MENTPPSLRRAPPTGATLFDHGPTAVAAPVQENELPPLLAKIPGIRAELLTEADLLLADPATHTHPLGSHSLLPIHPGYDQPHSHPPFNQHPVIDVETGDVISEPELDIIQLHPEHHPVHAVHPAAKPHVIEEINSIHNIPHHIKPEIHYPKKYHPAPAYPAPYHPTPAPYHPTPAPYHPTPEPYHVPSPVPPHHGHHEPHYNHYKSSGAPIPLGYQKDVPVKLRELHPVPAPHPVKAPYAHHGLERGVYPGHYPVVKSLHYDPYRPKSHYPQYEYKRQYYAQLY